MFPNDGFSSTTFDLFPIIFFIMFGIMLAFIILAIIQQYKQWSSNNKQPVLIVEAKIISKRTNITNHTVNNQDSMNIHTSSTSTSTDYYITFEVESGSRMEFGISGHEYGLLAEGDKGKLKFQGTRYLGFERIIENQQI